MEQQPLKEGDFCMNEAQYGVESNELEPECSSFRFQPEISFFVVVEEINRFFATLILYFVFLSD